MKPQFKKLFQIGIIVEDVEKSVEFYEKVLGMGPWRMAEMNKDVFEDMHLIDSDGKECELLNKCAFCNAFGLEIELIQPIKDNPYKAWMDEHGPGIHHIAVDTEDDFDTFMAKCKEITGKDAWIHGFEKNIGMDFAYVDLRKQIGAFVEIYNEDTSSKIGHDF